MNQFAVSLSVFYCHIFFCKDDFLNRRWNLSQIQSQFLGVNILHKNILQFPILYFVFQFIESSISGILQSMSATHVYRSYGRHVMMSLSYFRCFYRNVSKLNILLRFKVILLNWNSCICKNRFNIFFSRYFRIFRYILNSSL